MIETEADKAVRIFNRLRIPDVPGKPRFGDLEVGWFRDIIRAVFGSYNPDTNIRMISEVFLLVPKKNMKSTALAAVMLTAAIMNRRPLAELLYLAPTKEIADISFGQSVGMVRADEELSKRFHPRMHIRRIDDLASGGEMKIVAADEEALTGSKATYTLIDETHVFAMKGRAAHVFVEARGALASRPDGFLCQITTQSKEPPSGQFKKELNLARRVRDGQMQRPLLPILYELPEDLAKDGGWKRPERLAMVNPNLGRSVRLDYIQGEIERAEEEGPEELALIASQHANVEVGIGLKTDGWAGAPYWNRGTWKERAPLTLDELIDRSDVVTYGIDGGGLDDLFGNAAIGREAQTRRWLLWVHALISPEGMERRKANQGKYREFEAEGSLTIVEGLPDDLEWLKDTVALIKDSGKLSKVGADPAGIGGAVDALAEIGVTQENGLLTGVAQGIRLMNAAKTLERKLVDGTLLHDGSRMMAWAVGHAKVRQTSTASLIERAASGFGKIDPLVAAFNASHLMSLNPDTKVVTYERGQMFA